MRDLGCHPDLFRLAVVIKQIKKIKKKGGGGQMGREKILKNVKKMKKKQGNHYFMQWQRQHKQQK